MTKIDAEPLVAEVVPPRLLSFLLVGMVGLILHIGLGSWLRPRGWERRAALKRIQGAHPLQ